MLMMSRPTAWVLTCLAAAVAAHVACGAAPEPESGRDANLTPPTGAAATPTTTPARQGEWRVVFLGDSLTAGLGLPVEQAFPALIERRLRERGRGWTVVNAGVSGDTSAGGLRRLDWAIDGHASIVVVALGGNDALRGLPTDDLAKNLDAIVTRATSSGAAVVLAGMEAPPNNGPEYTDRFRRVYREVAARHTSCSCHSCWRASRASHD